jgi:hypothetical protein
MSDNGNIRVKGGSIGGGTNALLTIITVEKESDKLVEETFKVPYLLIDTERVNGLLMANLIRGFRIEKMDEGKACPFHGEVEL